MRKIENTNKKESSISALTRGEQAVIQDEVIKSHSLMFFSNQGEKVQIRNKICRDREKMLSRLVVFSDMIGKYDELKSAMENGELPELYIDEGTPFSVSVFDNPTRFLYGIVPKDEINSVMRSAINEILSEYFHITVEDSVLMVQSKKSSIILSAKKINFSKIPKKAKRIVKFALLESLKPSFNRYVLELNTSNIIGVNIFISIDSEQLDEILKL